jgi:hypothetical protein
LQKSNEKGEVAEEELIRGDAVEGAERSIYMGHRGAGCRKEAEKVMLAFREIRV